MNLLASSPAAMFLTVFRRCLSACHRQSVGRHPDADGATVAPFRLLVCTCESWEKKSEIRCRKFSSFYIVLNTTIVMCEIEIICLQPVIQPHVEFLVCTLYVHQCSHAITCVNFHSFCSLADFHIFQVSFFFHFHSSCSFLPCCTSRHIINVRPFPNDRR